SRKIPSMLNYKTHLDKESMFNTPPVYAVYVSLLTMRWLKEQGGITAIEELNKKKATLLYSESDINPLFICFTSVDDRSIMNATYTLKKESLKEKFDSMWKETSMNELNNHRSIKKYRASMYNALPLESVQVLVDVMSDLERSA